ncbi:MAG: hypothetical protein AB1Z57_00460 [Acidimicrobiia bacterium]
MRTRAWVLIVVSGLLWWAAVVATYANGTLDAERAIGLAAFAVFSIVGSLLVLRVGSNAVSWVTLGCGALGSLYNVGDALDERGVGLGGPTSTTAFFSLILLFTVVLPTIFPSGAPLGPRWRWPVHMGVGGWLTLGVGRLLGWVHPTAWTEIVYDVSEVVGLFALVAAAMAAVTSIIVRWVRADGPERLQLDWLAVAFSLVVAGIIDEFVVPGNSPAAGILLSLGGLGVPVAIGLAITRYRLYDVGRILSRTVAYLVLAGFVAVGYALGAVWLPTRLGTENPLFVAGTTLAILMALNPVRRWLITRLDRRFNRTPYEPDAVLDRLTTGLRSATDIPTITGMWGAEVGAALEPVTLTVWTRT